jgi:hypothetical protein
MARGVLRGGVLDVAKYKDELIGHMGLQVYRAKLFT